MQNVGMMLTSSPRSLRGLSEKHQYDDPKRQPSSVLSVFSCLRISCFIYSAGTPRNDTHTSLLSYRPLSCLLKPLLDRCLTPKKHRESSRKQAKQIPSDFCTPWVIKVVRRLRPSLAISQCLLASIRTLRTFNNMSL